MRKSPALLRKDAIDALEYKDFNTVSNAKQATFAISDLLFCPAGCFHVVVTEGEKAYTEDLLGLSLIHI